MTRPALRLRNRVAAIAAAAVACVAGLSFVLSAPAPAGDAAAPGLRVAGTIAVPSATPLRMLVDPELNLGFAILPGVGGDNSDALQVYDLAALKVVGQVKVPSFGLSADQAFVDVANHRILFPPGARGAEAAGCSTGPNPLMAVAVFDIRSRGWSTLPVPCSSGDQFKTQGLWFHAATNRLYSVGTLQADRTVRSLAGTTADRYGQTLLLRSVNVATGALDWELDLRMAGCDAIVSGPFGGFVGRSGDDVVSYCYGPRNSTEGSQGFALRIPLKDERPARGTDARTAVVTTPTLPNDLVPILDADGGRLLLLTAGAANGNAVWVFDIARDRFFGVIASGVAVADGVATTTYAGLDAARGRAYLLTGGDVLVADARHDPLPAGLGFRVVEGMPAQGTGPYVAVAPKLRRLFVPVRNKGFLAIDDTVVEPVDPPTPDPDRGTADIAEQPGRTGSVHSGVATAFGAHILNTGGVPRAVDNADPLCYTLASAAVKDARGRCLADQVLTAGNREAFLAPTVVEATSETGATAFAAGSAFASKDTATDADFRRLGGCMADLMAERSGAAAPAQYTSTCGATPLASLRTGTRGTDGRGAPVPGAVCESFVGAPAKTDERTAAAGGQSLGGQGRGTVACDGTARRASGSASSAVLALPETGEPTIAVGRSTSAATTTLTAEGVVTTVTATATDVLVAGITIGRVETSVTTKAHGRTGTTKVSFSRRITDVNGPGIACASCDPAAVVSAVNAALGQRVRASLPDVTQTASPKGYQALVLKDPQLRDSDRALNDDDTFTVAGLQVVLFNDGRFGRSRVVVHLAGVQAESRYGIFVLPDATDGVDAAGGPDLLPAVDVPGGSVDVPSVTVGVDPVPVAADTSIAGQLAPVVANLASGNPAKAAVEAVKVGTRLIVSHPREFALLLTMWSLLAAPAYLGLRRRWMHEELDG